jgi:hypothetical protein
VQTHRCLMTFAQGDYQSMTSPIKSFLLKNLSEDPLKREANNTPLIFNVNTLKQILLNLLTVSADLAAKLLNRQLNTRLSRPLGIEFFA